MSQVAPPRIIQGYHNDMVALGFPHRLGPVWVLNKDLAALLDELRTPQSGRTELQALDHLLARFDNPSAIPGDVVTLIREYIKQRLEADII